MTIYCSGVTNDIVYYKKALNIINRYSTPYNLQSASVVMHSALRLLDTANQDVDVYRQYRRDPTSFVCRDIHDYGIYQEAYEHHRHRP